MSDESVKDAFARLLGTLGDAAPYLTRLVEDTRLAVAAVVAREERRDRQATQMRAALEASANEHANAQPPATVAAPAAPAPTSAPAANDEQGEDPYIENDPQAWLDARGNKASMKGMRMSECPSEYLVMMIASRLRRAKHFDERNKPLEAEKERRIAAMAQGHVDRLRPQGKHQAEHRTISADDVLHGRAK